MDQAFFCFCMKAKTRKIAWKGEKKKKKVLQPETTTVPLSSPKLN